MAQTSRRDFVKWLALTAAGAAALPEQILAFERYYEVNTPQVASGLVSVDEIWLSGAATTSTPVVLRIAKPPLNFGVNLFGGVMRWAAMPDQKIIAVAKDFSWQIENLRQPDEHVPYHGHIAYVDQDMRRHYRPITPSGSLA